jgi:tRNA pseudouridine38-40 synthase
LDEQAMVRAAGKVEGEHDFTSFAAVDPERSAAKPEGSAGVPPALTDSENARRHEGAPVSNIRRIFSSNWERQGDEFVYTVKGSGFLHHMVRNLVGTFILVGKATLRAEDVTRILQARNRSAAGATAPASGLYLVNVEY